jgi:hypothetical protein
MGVNRTDTRKSDLTTQPDETPALILISLAFPPSSWDVLRLHTPLATDPLLLLLQRERALPLDGKGKIVCETKLPTDPEIIACFIAV